MRIGIDFDNTIACYDGVFYQAALERDLIPVDLPTHKNAVRDHINAFGHKNDFTHLQGYVYGSRMDLVKPYDGFTEFVGEAREQGHQLFIVSHKTRHPLLGPKHDMHAAARGFLHAHQFIGSAGIANDAVFFEPTKDAKVKRASELKVDIFIDDLPEILEMPGFPVQMRGLLFDPDDQHAQSRFERHQHWAGLAAALLDG